MSDQEFIDIVRKLRNHQRRWIRRKNPNDLTEAINLERQVDRWLEREAGPKVARSLFDSCGKITNRPRGLTRKSSPRGRPRQIPKPSHAVYKDT